MGRLHMVDGRRVYEIFAALQELPAAERVAALERACASDPALRTEVEALLSIADCDTRAMQGMVEVPPSQIPSLVGRQLGHYRLVERIGQGGSGVVYRAERIDEVPQTVAIKVLLGELAGAEYLRFQREAQILARLEHPSVARLIDVGTEDGRAWIALEYVRGRPIDAYCDEHALDLRARVALLSAVADAIASAHRMLVVHRDIKPGNVLVTETGVPKILDFGIGTTLGAAGQTQAPTVSVGRLFTPNFSSPEQVLGEPPTVATDVFGLGALGYRLLSGGLAFAEAAEPLRYISAVTHEDVKPPSAAARQAGKPERVVEGLRGDLDAILCKAMARRPQDRYASASDLRADLERYLRREPVTARRLTLAYRLRRFGQRHTLAVIVGGVLLLAGTVGAVMYVQQERAVTRAQRIAAERGDFLDRLLRSANPAGGRRDVLVADILDKALAQKDEEISADPLVAASILGVIARSEKGLGRLREARLANDRRLALVRAHGASDEQLVESLNLQSLLLYMQGDLRGAEAPTLETLRVLGYRCTADGAYADTLDILGEIQVSLRSDEQAEQSFRQEAACAEQIHSQTRRVHALNNIVLLDKGRDRASEALSAGAQAVRLGRQVFAPTAPFLLTTELNLADAMSIAHQAPEAEPLIRAVMALRLKVLGPQHLETLMTGTSLAINLVQQQRYAEAAETAQSAARALEQQVGADHFLTANAWQAYAIAACHNGQGQAGLEALQRSLAVRSKKYGPDSWQTQLTQLYRGTCLLTLHRDAEALALLQPTVQALATSRGTGFYAVQEGYAALRDAADALGDHTGAQQWAARIRPAP